MVSVDLNRYVGQWDLKHLRSFKKKDQGPIFPSSQLQQNWWLVWFCSVFFMVNHVRGGSRSATVGVQDVLKFIAVVNFILEDANLTTIGAVLAWTTLTVVSATSWWTTVLQCHCDYTESKKPTLDPQGSANHTLSLFITLADFTFSSQALHLVDS